MSGTITEEQLNHLIGRAVESRLKNTTDEAERIRAEVKQMVAAVEARSSALEELKLQWETQSEAMRRERELLLNREGPQAVTVAERMALGGFRSRTQARRFGLFLFAVAGNEAAKKRCEEQGIAWRTASSVDASEGGALVPEEFFPEIQSLQDVYGTIRNVCLRVPMGTGAMSIPKLTSGFTVYFPGEGVAPTASDLTFGLASLRPKDYAVLCYAPENFVEDAAVSVAQLVFGQMALALSQAEDTNAINGDGTSTYANTLGLINGAGAKSVETAASGEASFAALKARTWIKAAAHLHAASVPGASWLMHPSILALARGLTDTTDRPLVQDLWVAGGTMKPFLLGFPVHTCAVMNAHTLGTQTSAVAALFGDWRKSLAMGDRQQITVKQSAEYKFAEGLITFLGKSRVDFNVLWPGDSSYTGGYVVLKTAGS